MALDLKLEIFAYNLFSKAFLTTACPDIPQIFGEECLKVENYMEACNESFQTAVVFRRWAFRKLHQVEFTEEKVKSITSPSDVFDFIISACDRDDLFGHLQIFERMFATCSFVINFCIQVSMYGNVDLEKNGYLLWAMYFDKFTKEFYSEGGWKALLETALSYHDYYEMISYFKENEFHLLDRSINDYYEFMDNDLYDESKSELKNTKVSILWIKYRIEQSKNCPKIPVTYEKCDQISDIDEVLENLKALFSVILEENYLHQEKTNSVKFDEYDTYLDSLNAHEKLPLNQIDESLCSLTPSLSVPGTSNLDSEIRVKESNVEEEECSKKGLEINCSPKDGEQKIESTERTKIISRNQTTKTIFDRNSPSDISTKCLGQSFDPEETETFSGTSNTAGEFFENQKEVLLGCGKFVPHSVTDPTIHSSEKSVEEIGIDKNLGINYTPRTSDYQKEIMLKTEIRSTNQNAETKSNRNNFQESLPTIQIKTMYMDNSPSESSKSECKSPTALENVSENQMDVSLCYRKPPPYNVTDATNFISEKCIKDSVEEISDVKGIEVNCNLKNIEQQIEIAERVEILSTKHTVKTKFEINSLNRISTQQCVDNSYFEGQSETPYKSITRKHVKSKCYRSPPPYTVPDAPNRSSEKKGKGSVEERGIKNPQEVSPSTLKNVYDQEKILASKESVSTTLTPDSKCNEKRSLDILPKRQLMDMYTDDSPTKKLKKECKTLNTNEILPKIQMDASLDSRTSPLSSVPNARNHDMERNAIDEQKIIEKTIEVDCTSGNEDNQRNICNRPEVISLSKIVISESEGKTDNDSLHVPKVLNTENQCEIIDVEMEKVIKSGESFKSEQDDCDIQTFLRMILVLNDIRHAKFVSKALQYKADLPEKTKDVKNKRRKIEKPKSKK